MYSEETLKTLPHTISLLDLRSPEARQSNLKANPKKPYRMSLARAGAIAAAGALLSGAITVLSPLSASSYWPFTSARAADELSPLLHDPSIRLLAAALNLDPNPAKAAGDIMLSDGTALTANMGPDGSMTTGNVESLSAHNSNGTISVYTVQDGDSISGIASSHGVSVNTILWANDLTVKSTITPGMSLVILPVSGTQHTVRGGETLSSIADKYDASAQEIATFNGLDASATVVVGSELIIPGGEVKASAPSTAKKTTTKTTTTTTSSTKKTTTTTTTTTSSAIGTSKSVSSYYTNPVPGAILFQGLHGNSAVDLSAPSGTPIYAAAAGSVIVSKGDGGWNGGYGSYVVISHGNGTQTLYAHMSKDIVSVGDTVAAGELIGYVGATGEATGNHLHFEVRGAKNWLSTTCSTMSRCY